MYNYFNFSSSFASYFKIDNNLFDMDLANEKIICEYDEYEEFDIHLIKNNYFQSYQYKQNTEENWQSISFRINSQNKFEVLNILNKEFSKIDDNIINMDDALDQLRLYSEYEFHHFEGENLLINGIISDDESYISISKQIITEHIKVPKKVNSGALVA